MSGYNMKTCVEVSGCNPESLTGFGRIVWHAEEWLNVVWWSREPVKATVLEKDLIISPTSSDKVQANYELFNSAFILFSFYFSFNYWNNEHMLALNMFLFSGYA